MDFIVRLSKESDLINLEPVNLSAKDTLRRVYQRIESVHQIDELPTTLIVAETTNGQLVGRCEYRICNGELYFLSLGVLASYRRKGVLGKIVEFLESVAKQEKCNKITCETIEETGNREIFEKMSMVCIGRRQSLKYMAPDGKSVHELMMSKIFDGSHKAP